MNRLAISAEGDYLTCPRCRACIGVGRICQCSMRTTGPKIEAQLTRIANGRAKTARSRR